MAVTSNATEPQNLFARALLPPIVVGGMGIGLAVESARWFASLSERPAASQWKAIAIAVFLLFASGYFAFIVFRGLSTHISTAGVARWEFGGRRLFRWSDLCAIDSRGYTARLRFTDGAVVVNSLFYRQPAAVARFILERRPSNVKVWS